MEQRLGMLALLVPYFNKEFQIALPNILVPFVEFT